MTIRRRSNEHPQFRSASRPSGPLRHASDCRHAGAGHRPLRAHAGEEDMPRTATAMRCLRPGSASTWCRTRCRPGIAAGRAPPAARSASRPTASCSSAARPDAGLERRCQSARTEDGRPRCRSRAGDAVRGGCLPGYRLKSSGEAVTDATGVGVAGAAAGAVRTRSSIAAAVAKAKAKARNMATSSRRSAHFCSLGRSVRAPGSTVERS